MSEKLYKTSGISIPKSHYLYEKIKSDLTRDIKDLDGNSNIINFYIEKKDTILIPRYYDIPDDIKIVDRSNIGIDIEIDSHIIPRNDLQALAIKTLVDSQCCVLKLETSRGKTALTIAAISEIKKKSIILVHKKSLIKNWIIEFLKHTSIKEEDIGILSSNKYEKILAKPIIMATPQVISRAYNTNKHKFITSINKSGIGILIVDEVHAGIGSKEFTKASLLINARRTFGLSATPTRQDGTTDIINYHMGPLIYIKPETNEMLVPSIHAIFKDYKLFPKYRRYVMYNNKFNFQSYYKCMKNSDIFLTSIVSNILKAYNADRNILILGSNVNCLLEIATALKLPTSEIGMFLPTIYADKKKKKELVKVSDAETLDVAFKEKRIVFATYTGARDGNNRENLDTLIMITPTNNAEQAVGRILRQCDNKKTPLVIEFIDTGVYKINSAKGGKVSIFERSYEKRKESVYDIKNWKVNEIREKDV